LGHIADQQTTPPAFERRTLSVPANSLLGGTASASRQKRMVLIGILIAATLLLYNPVVHHEFINFDDPDYVTANVHVSSGLSVQNVVWAFKSLETGNWLPLTWLSHMLDCQLFRLNSSGHHYSNVLLHAANVILLFLLLTKMTGS